MNFTDSYRNKIGDKRGKITGIQGRTTLRSVSGKYRVDRKKQTNYNTEKQLERRL